MLTYNSLVTSFVICTNSSKYMLCCPGILSYMHFTNSEISSISSFLRSMISDIFSAFFSESEFPYRLSSFYGMLMSSSFISSSSISWSLSTSKQLKAICMRYSIVPIRSLRKKATNSSKSIRSSPFALI